LQGAVIGALLEAKSRSREIVWQQQHSAAQRFDETHFPGGRAAVQHDPSRGRADMAV
jgi:hypothetical protein